MIAVADLKAISRSRLKDARVLLKGKRYDGAAYLAGYSVEIALKARICQTLGWLGFPDSGREFNGYSSFKTHDLAVLLHLSGYEAPLQGRYPVEWGIIVTWNPEERYSPVGAISAIVAQDRIAASQSLVSALLRRK